MAYNIRKAVVIGSGTMGGGIASLLAGGGVDVLLLDIPARDTQPGDPSGKRSAVANEGLKRELTATQDQLATLQKQVADPTDRNVQRAEIDRLKDENKSLTDKLASLEASNALIQNELDALKPPLPKAEVPSDKKDELKLPSHEDMERAKAALGDAWRKLMDMIGQMQKEMLGNKDDPPVRL